MKAASTRVKLDYGYYSGVRRWSVILKQVQENSWSTAITTIKSSLNALRGKKGGGNKEEKKQHKKRKQQQQSLLWLYLLGCLIRYNMICLEFLFLNNSLYNTTRLTLGNISTQKIHTHPAPNKKRKKTLKKWSLMRRGRGMVEHI